MTEKIKKIIIENWVRLPVSERCSSPAGSLGLTKFYHSRANWQSKVLFLVTYNALPICLVKTTRNVAANDKLKKEKDAQEKFGQAKNLAAPAVYFDGLINGYYFYAEEVVSGQPLAASVAFQKEKEIINLARSFSAIGQISAQALAEIFQEKSPEQDATLKELIGGLVSSEVVLKIGFTHGDLTRKNIIDSQGRLRLIDWERAGERPFWLLDAVHFGATLRDIKDLADWQRRGQEAFCQNAGASSYLAAALYCVEAILEIFCKQYPGRYAAIVAKFAKL